MSKPRPPFRYQPRFISFIIETLHKLYTHVYRMFDNSIVFDEYF